MNTLGRLTCIAALVPAAAPVHAQCPDLDLRFAAPRSGVITSLVVHDTGAGPRLFAGSGNPGLSAWAGERWETVPGTESAFVRALAVHDFGAGPELVVAGDFSAIDGVAANRIARWNGTTWSALGAGLGNAPGATVYALASFDAGAGARLVATGSFTASGGTPAAGIAAFDGVAWQPLGAGLDGYGRALAVVDLGAGAELAVGGTFGQAGGVAAANVALWDGVAWSALAGGTEAEVTALCARGPAGAQTLVAGGAFRTAGGVQANFIAGFDGATWAAFGPGLAAGASPFAGVSALIADGLGFIAAGRFESPTLPVSSNVARWDGAAWQPFAGGLGITTYVGVDALARFDPLDGGGERLFAAGAFAPQPGQPASIAQWNGTAWRALRDDGAQGLRLDSGASGAVSATLWQGDLVVAGEFLGAGSAADAAGVARFDGTTWHAMGTTPAQTYIDHPWVVRALDLGAGPELLMGMSRYFTHDATVPVYRWTGTDWLPLASGTLPAETDVRVFDVAAFDDGGGTKLYAAGYGLRAQAGGVVDTVLRWDGSAWSRLDNGPVAALGGMVHRLTVFDDGTGAALYAGGSFAGGVKRWNGAVWTQVGANFEAPSGIPPAVVDFEVFDAGAGPRLIAGGGMHTIGGVPVHGVARWNGTAWEPLPGSSTVFPGVLGLEVFDDGRGSGPRLFAMKHTDELVAFDGTTWESLARTDPYFTFARIFASDGLPGGGGVVMMGDYRSVAETGAALVAQAGITILRNCPRVMGFCAGDGLDAELAAACPCANTGAVGRGCAWSASGAGTGGARLASTGAPGANDLVLAADSMPTGGTSLFFQGSPDPAGAVFGDGLRCAGSPTVRLRTRQNVAGAAQVPAPGEPPLSTLGGVAPGSGEVRAYQVWFRVAAPFCTSAPFNTTNALRVHW